MGGMEHTRQEPEPASIVIGGAGHSLELVAAVRASTVAAALAARAWVGRGDKNAADEASVAAMRAVLQSAPFAGTVVIGEGEKDAAPMLANGERLGTGDGPEYDIAVDPLDGTRLAAENLPGAVSVIALAPRGTMFDPVDTFYMHKLISDATGLGVLSLSLSPTENVTALAAARAIDVAELVVAVLDKPRHAPLIAELTAAGVRVLLKPEGDVSTAIAAATPGSGIDLVMGIGGTPEGIIAACAVRALGGFIEGRLAPQSPEERAAATAAGHDLARILGAADLVGSSRVLFASANVT
jgi:fructose-1,6-bisphosphatase II